MARHPQRPHCLDYVAALIDDFTPVAGDRKFGDDEAIVGGFGRFRGEPVCRRPREGVNHGRPHPPQFRHGPPRGLSQGGAADGTRRSFRHSGAPLIDTAGAYPGIGAEERGQAEAIARSTEACLQLTVPNVAVMLGEGGSGGAIAIATANRVLMLEHAIYSVISPEGAASILWRDTTKAEDAAINMKITAQDLVKFGIIDGIITEPAGGAHRDPAAAIKATGEAVAEAFRQLGNLDREAVRKHRREKFLNMGRTL